jgi:ribose/xylose/arabinose/galactoside ABC-type transport system permease subunit
MSEKNNNVSVAKDPRSPWTKFMSLNGSGVFLALVVWVIFLVIFCPIINNVTFDVGTNIISVFKQQAYLGVIAAGLTLVMITGNIDLSVGSMLTLMTCIVPDLYNSMGFAGALIGGLVIGGLFGLVNGALVAGLGLNAFITTIAMGCVYGSLAIIYSEGGYKVVQNASSAFNFFGKGMIGNVIPASVITLAVVVVVLAFILNRTVFGQRLFAIGANPTAARFSGVRSRRDLALTYVITGMTVGLSAVMTIANVGNSNPQAGSGKEMDIVLAVVLGGTSVAGGKGSVWGTAVGFAFIGFLSNGFTALGLSQYAQWVITGIILVAALSADVLKDKGVKLWKRK